MAFEPLISADEVRSRISEAVVIDASWIYPPFNKAEIDVRRRYADAHIPGSWFLDLASLSKDAPAADGRIDALVRPSRGVVRAVASAAVPLASSLVVLTDMDGGCTTAPFARHLLIDAGYENVRVLDGGTPSWAYECCFPVTGAEPKFLVLEQSPEGRKSVPSMRFGECFADFNEVIDAIRGHAKAQLLDCRGTATNAGVLPTDYEGFEIPCECVIRSSDVVEAQPFGERFRRKDELVRLFAERAADRARTKIATCYFGVGASVVATALEIVRWGPVRVYAGSLVEYVSRTRQDSCSQE